MEFDNSYRYRCYLRTPLGPKNKSLHAFSEFEQRTNLSFTVSLIKSIAIFFVHEFIVCRWCSSWSSLKQSMLTLTTTISERNAYPWCTTRQSDPTCSQSNERYQLHDEDTKWISLIVGGYVTFWCPSRGYFSYPLNRTITANWSGKCSHLNPFGNYSPLFWSCCSME